MDVDPATPLVVGGEFVGLRLVLRPEHFFLDVSKRSVYNKTSGTSGGCVASYGTLCDCSKTSFIGVCCEITFSSSSIIYVLTLKSVHLAPHGINHSHTSYSHHHYIHFDLHDCIFTKMV